MMTILRATEEWQRAGVHYVRAAAMIREFGVDLLGEFIEDSPSSLYVLVLKGREPVSTCRLRLVAEGTGKIERVATVGEYRGKGYGRAAITEAEGWLKEMGASRILISSRTAVVGFYQALGYTPNWGEVTGSGTFECVMVEKII